MPKTTTTVKLSNGDEMTFYSAFKYAFAKGAADYDPDAIAANRMPYVYYLDDNIRQAYFCGWAFAKDQK